MLNNAHLTTILPAVDLERARRFYSQTLGLKEERKTAEGGVRFRAGDGTDLELVPRGQPSKSEYTALTFEVSDVEGELRDLEGRGVKFEDYDLPGLKTERHIAIMGSEKAAWFKDPDGNILCIHQGGRPRA